MLDDATLLSVHTKKTDAPSHRGVRKIKHGRGRASAHGAKRQGVIAMGGGGGGNSLLFNILHIYLSCIMFCKSTNIFPIGRKKTLPPRQTPAPTPHFPPLSPLPSPSVRHLLERKKRVKRGEKGDTSYLLIISQLLSSQNRPFSHLLSKKIHPSEGRFCTFFAPAIQ